MGLISWTAENKIQNRALSKILKLKPTETKRRKKYRKEHKRYPGLRENI